MNDSIIWHHCMYIKGTFTHNGRFVDGRWYEFLDKYDNREVARMKRDAIDHFFPPTKIIKEEDIIAFREVE